MSGPERYWAQYRARYHTGLPQYRDYIPGRPGYFGAERARYNKWVAERRRHIIKARKMYYGYPF
jgi:hypothetical protein